MTSHGAVEGEIGNCQPRDGWFGCGRKGEDATVGGVQPVGPRGDTATARGGCGGSRGCGCWPPAPAPSTGRGGRRTWAGAVTVAVDRITVPGPVPVSAVA